MADPKQDPRQLAAKILLQRRHARNDAEVQGAGDLIRRSFKNFNEWGFLRLNPSIPANCKFGWHMGCIAEHIEAMVFGQIKTLVINIPPREGKSFTCSVNLPAYLLGRWPATKIICASYAMPLSTDLSVKCRRLMEDAVYKQVYPGTRIAKDQNEKTKYETTAHGVRYSTSVGASATGFGGTWKIIDDPHDPQRAASPTELEASITWYRETWSTRSDDPKKTRELLIQQRLGPNDLTGYFIEAKPDSTFLKLPRRAEIKTVVVFPLSCKEHVRPVGDILSPDRYSKEMVADLEKVLGTFGFAAQQQQEPVARGGDRIKKAWFPRYLEAPPFDEVWLSVDTASKEREINCPSAIMTLGRAGKFWYLVDYWQENKNFPDLLTAVETAASKAADLYGSKFNRLIIEDKSTGTSIIQAYKHSKTQLPPRPVMAFDPTPHGGKIERFDTNSNWLEAGYLKLPDESLKCSWLPKVERELWAFPKCTYMEPIDCLSQFLIIAFSKNKLANHVRIGSISKPNAYRG